MGILKALRWLLRGWEEHGGQAFFLFRPFWQVGGEEARERQAASASVTPIPIPADSALFVYFLGISKSYPRLGRHPALFRENYFPTLFGRCFLPEQFWLSDGCLFQETAGGTSAGPLPAGWPAGISLGPRARPRQPCTHSCTHAHGAWTQACPTGCLSLPPLRRGLQPPSVGRFLVSLRNRIGKRKISGRPCILKIMQLIRYPREWLG